ncbi:hypothetical protein V2J09_022411 [Rumex salicifolius]
MGLNELQSFWKRETRRLVWLMAALFVIITLFQYIELPKGTFVLSIFSTGKPQIEEKNSSVVVSTDSAFPPMELNPSSSLSEEILAPEPNDPLDGPPLDNVKDQPKDYNNHFSSETTEKGFALALVSDVRIFSLSPVSPVSTPPPNNIMAPLSSSGINLLAPNIPVRPNSSLTLKGNVVPPLPSSHVRPGRYQMPVRDVPRWSSKVDQELLHAKVEIENAAPVKDLQLYTPIYRNFTMFHRSYELMEQMLKIYIYKEGDRPVFHQAPLEGIYASEGWFMKLMESNKHFVTKDPKKAHLFYIPFSSRNLEEALYVPNSHSHKNLIKYLEKYLDTITRKYSFWNRTGGADHFLVACHDWAPSETHRIMSSCIRAMCNADVKEGFKVGKDVSLPETYIPKAKSPLRGRGGKPPSQRRILAFFAGQMHGYLRPVLLRHWQNMDPGMKIFGRLPHAKGNKNYIGYMQSSKYCICARGYEVNSPRVVEAIFYECVPVIISDNFVPPLFETLNWESFAVFVAEKDVPNLKTILESIPEKTYLRLYMRVKKVQQHFLWRPNPVKYDLFHMILHSIWYNRVSQFVPNT